MSRDVPSAGEDVLPRGSRCRDSLSRRPWHGASPWSSHWAACLTTVLDVHVQEARLNSNRVSGLRMQADVICRT